MKARSLMALAILVLIHTLAPPAGAGVKPYVRLNFGVSHFNLAEINSNIERDQTAIRGAGYTADLKTVGAANGPGGSAGIWIFPAFRVGATYSDLRTNRDNRVHEPGSLFYDDRMDLRMTEVGAEAAVRIERLAGLTFGGSVARGRASIAEGYSLEQVGSQVYDDYVAKGTKTTYGAFLGIDQTNPNGVAGFIRLGYAYRDMGSLPGSGTSSDGTTSTAFTANSVPMDYSGMYFRCGVGFDFFH